MLACAVALVLLLDASASILPPEWELQVQGHAAALESEAVGAVIEREPVAVKAMSFSDNVTVLVGWRLLTSAADARAMGAELRRVSRGLALGTNIPLALRRGREALADAPCAADLGVLDLVTDGEADAPPTARERDLAFAEGVRINALGVGSPEAADWLRENAITPGGFVLQVRNWEGFAPAVRRKMVVELAGR